MLETIDEDWGTGGPPVSGVDEFSARWTPAPSLPGTYELPARSDDGIRAYVDGVRVLDEWRHQGADQLFTETVALAGQHTLVVEYYEAGGGALARFDVAQLRSPTCPRRRRPASAPRSTARRSLSPGTP